MCSKKTMKEGKSFFSDSYYIINSKKKCIPVAVSTYPLRNEKGDIKGYVEIFRDHTLIEDLKKELFSGYQLEDIISKKLEMQKIFTILPQVSASDSSILIEGETGTGKELMAKAIHNLSFRKNKPFIDINCGALTDSLVESELFGYKAGVFTNAVKDKPGYFNIAEGGTILLDEIGETTSAFQVKLLRFLEKKEFQPLWDIKKSKYSYYSWNK